MELMNEIKSDDIRESKRFDFRALLLLLLLCLLNLLKRGGGGGGGWGGGTYEINGA